MKKILTIIFIFASLFASSQELMNKNFEGFRVKVSELVIDNDTLNNCTGIDSKDYHYRILQKNGTTTVRSYNKYASTGTQVLRNEKAYVHVAAGSKVWCEIMSPSSAPGSITIQGAKIYAMQRYLEK